MSLLIILPIFATVFLIFSTFYLTCTKRQRTNLLTPPSQRGKREPASVKESLKNVVSKSESKKSKKSTKDSKASEKSKSSKSSRRGEPRQTLVSIKKLSKEKAKSPSQDSAIRSAGRNSLQTEPPTPHRSISQRSSSRDPPPQPPPPRPIQQRSNRSNRLPAFPPSLPSDNNNSNQSSTRVTRSSIRKSLIDSNSLPSEPRIEVLPQNAAPHSIKTTTAKAATGKKKKASSQRGHSLRHTRDDEGFLVATTSKKMVKTDKIASPPTKKKATNPAPASKKAKAASKQRSTLTDFFKKK